MNFEHVHLPGIFAAIDYNLLPTRYTCLSFTLRVVCVCVCECVCVLRWCFCASEKALYK